MSLCRSACVAVLAAVAFGLVPATPARAAVGGCSVGTAPVITSGATQTSDPTACPDGRQFWAIDLAIGDTLNADVAAAGNLAISLDIYGPNVGTIGSALCNHFLDSQPYRLGCLIPAAGRYLLVTKGAAGSLTPTVVSVPPQRGRVSGACEPLSAPVAPSSVTEFANGQFCAPSGNRQYWRIQLRLGDALHLSVKPGGPNAMPITVNLLDAGTIGAELCSHFLDSVPYQVSCPPVHGTGEYLITTQYVGSFAPLVTHPTSLPRPSIVKGGGALIIIGHVTSNAPHVSGTCVVEERVGRRWRAIGRKHTATGSYRVRAHPLRHGLIRVRIRFVGDRGWKSSTGRPISVRVP